MNQEIQQNTTDTTENKKPRMYVSWKVILLDFLVAVALSFFGMLLAEILLPYDRISSFIGVYYIVYGIILFLCIVLLLIISVFKKMFTRVKVVNSMFVVFGLLLFVVIFSSKQRIEISSITSFRFWYELMFFTFSIYGIYLTIKINRKFQKSGSELGI